MPCFMASKWERSIFCDGYVMILLELEKGVTNHSLPILCY